VRLGGPLGAALEASRRGRLFHFITDERSPAVALFDRERAAANLEGDWYGEHAGKWLWAAARAAAGGGDDVLAARVRRVADHLVSLQEPDGYLGTYAPARRFMVPQGPKPGTWDGAPAQRTWDIWIHAYLILGLLEAHRHQPTVAWLRAACRIGDLCLHTLDAGGIAITSLGNHHGLSATVLIDPAMELHAATGDTRYLDLARHVLQQAEDDPALAPMQRTEAGADASEIATGKAYQLSWNLVGLAKLHRATGEARVLQVVQRLWASICQHHLSLGGGPAGGVGLRSRECFNPRGVFSPQAYVETCSTLAWLQLNRELLAITGDARHAEEIERSAYNDLLCAAAPDGEDWCYYVYANGRRVHTTAWRCCKSSGAMALEELPELAWAQPAADTIAVQVYGPGAAEFDLPLAGRVRIEQQTRYPFDGDILLRLQPECSARFALRLRVPAWAAGARVTAGGDLQMPAPGGWCTVKRTWSAGDELRLHFPMAPTSQRRTHRNVQESRAPDGSPVAQTVLDDRWIAVTRGPLVYASGLVDGWRPHECIAVPPDDDAAWLQTLPEATCDEGPVVRLLPPGRAPIDMVPAYRAGGRADGAWRVTWLQLAPAEKIP